jgi:hypothetical protein
MEPPPRTAVTLVLVSSDTSIALPDWRIINSSAIYIAYSIKESLGRMIAF